MKKRANGIHATLTRWYRSRVGLVLESIAIGALAGFIVVFFRVSLEYAETFRSRLFDTLRSGSALTFALLIPVFIIVGLLLGWMSLKKPMIKGSGIPQIKGALLRLMRLDWFPELPMKIAGGILAIGFGLSLGREGPSVQIGAFVGKGVLQTARRPFLERKYLVTSGAAAGLAAAFNAPLAGVLFVLEELHRSFSPLLLACAMGASLAGDLVASSFFGLRPVFVFHTIVPLGISRFPYIILLGVLCALVGELFKRSLYGAQDAYEALRVAPLLRPAAALLVSIPFGLYLFDVTGGGHHLIVELSRSAPEMRMLLILLVGKIVFTAVSYGSGAAGGIFLPLLACGALTGEIFGNVLAYFGLVPFHESFNFMIIGMAAFFTGVVRAPVTGAVLILEMSGNFNHFSGLVAGCMAAFVFGDLIRSRSVYDVLLERILKKNPAPYRAEKGRKAILEIPVAAGSEMSHRLIKNVAWPAGCLVVGVMRGDAELIPNGDTELRQGDVVLALCGEETAADTKERLLTLGAARE